MKVWCAICTLLAGCSLLYDPQASGVDSDASMADAGPLADAIPQGLPGSACTEDEPCDSEVCDRLTRVCVDSQDVVYLSNEGKDTEPCSQFSPCASFDVALNKVGGVRQWIHFFGDGDEVYMVAETIDLAAVGTGETIMLHERCK